MHITRDCAFSKISEQFLPLIDQALRAYLESIQETKLLNIRLMGSVPRGEARPFHSDIDFVALCKNPLSENEKSGLNARAKLLSEKNTIVRKMDLEYEISGNMYPGREFIFITDSISLWGEDAYTETDYEIDPQDLANLITPNLDWLLDSYRKALDEKDTNLDRIQYSRWIGKDILKALRYRLIIEKQIYEKSPRNIHKELSVHYPQEKAVFDELLEAYHNPHNDPSKLRAILKAVEKIKDPYINLNS